MIHTFYANGTLAPTTPTPYVTDYQISRSLRFNESDTTYLNRTPASTGNRKTYTFSAWIKRSKTGSDSDTILSSMPSGGQFRIFFQTESPTNTLRIFSYTGSYQFQLVTTQVFRDFSAWGHLVLAIDTTQATNTDRVKVYWNGSQITSFGTATYPSQNADLQFNQASQPHSIGNTYYVGSTSGMYNGYMTEINFIDGQQLTPSSFGYTDPDTGVWSPLAFVGTYGTNGFYLNFSDNSNTTAATLGKDYSGNGNNWTPNNFSVTAGAGNDSLVDSPTSYGTDTGVGGEVRGNYCTLNPLVQRWDVYTASITNGNLDTADTVGDANNPYVFGTTLVSSGKFYWEITVTAIGTSAASFFIGVDSGKTQNGATFTDWVSYSGNGSKYVGSTSSSAYGATYTTGDVIGVALDKDAGTVTFYKNNTSQGAISLPTSVPMVAWLSPGANSGSATTNFGQRPFAYTAPSGFKALCTQNLPTPTIGATSATLANKYFDAVTYSGSSSSQTVVNSGAFQPDLVWAKSRSNAYNNILVDSLRGGNLLLISNSTAADTSSSGLATFVSNGITWIGGATGVNDTGVTYVDWMWKANGSGSSNTSGSITSTVSANTTSGFSVVTYTGNGTSNQTFGHGLGAKVDFAIIKSRSAVSSPAWMVWHRSVCSGNGKALALEETNAIQGPFGTPIWDSSNTSTQSSTTTFTIGANTTINASGATYVAYCFAEVAGYSKFGSYNGTGSADGPFVFTGFRPAYVLYKGSSASGGAWDIHDDARSPRNVAVQTLFANTSGAEGGIEIDILSNGFKIRDTSANANSSGVTYIYACFAENPFKYSLAR